MNRYLYYMILMNMLINVTAVVPRVLIRERYDGAVMALVWSTIIGTTFLYAFTKSIEKLPSQGMPEILDSLLPVWVQKPLMVCITLMWHTAGVMTMLAFADFTRKFINPDIPITSLVCLFSIVVTWIAQFPSRKILYLLEIIIVLSVPLITFILFKAFFNKAIRWDGIFAVAMYYNKWPSLSAISAGTYIFSGYINMAIFNRVFSGFKPRLLWLGGLFGLLIEITTVFVPIGFLGADAVNRYVFAWMSTADSMRIELGLIERVMYIFILLYGQLAFASMIIHWHVSFELGKSALNLKPFEGRRQDWKTWCLVAALFIEALLGAYWLNDRRLFLLGEIWLNVRLFFEFLLVVIVFVAARRLKMR